MGAAAFARYSCGLLAGSLLLMLATAAFNRIVDPFQYFGYPRIPGFNAVKSRLRFFEREVKPAVVRREQPEAVILGSSIAAIGFEPLHPALTDDGRARSYNFAMAGAPWKEVFCDLEYVLAHTHAKRIVFGMVAQPMPDADCGRSLAAMDENRLPEVLLSPQAVQHSLKTLRSQDPREPQTHTAEGRYLFFRDDPRVEHRARVFFEENLRGKSGCSEARLRASLDAAATPRATDVATPFDVSGLERIVAQVSGRDIQLRIVLYPRHVVGAEADYLCGEEAQRWLVMDRVARYLEAHPPAPPASVELWDFQGYGPPFDEPLGGGVLTYWQDPIHFNPVLGDRILDAMFGRGEPGANPVTGFGYRVESATLPARRAWLAEQRAAFLHAHPETWDTLMRLVPAHVPRLLPHAP
ncbi:MAG: hypothetical protein JNK68_14265 [Betaproteobacteria bacterium]|nr:hypothetical protein [Betaproteobacteria bacterium]